MSEPRPTTDLLVASLREQLRMVALAQPVTDSRESYSDGYAQGLVTVVRELDKIIDPTDLAPTLIDWSAGPRPEHDRDEAARQLRLAAENDADRETLLLWLADQIDPPSAAPAPVPYVHATLYRDHVLGSLCNSGAWGTPELFSAVIDRVTCPGCMAKLHGARGE